MLQSTEIHRSSGAGGGGASGASGPHKVAFRPYAQWEADGLALEVLIQGLGFFDVQLGISASRLSCLGDDVGARHAHQTRSTPMQVRRLSDPVTATLRISIAEFCCIFSTLRLLLHFLKLPEIPRCIFYLPSFYFLKPTKTKCCVCPNCIQKHLFSIFSDLSLVNNNCHIFYSICYKT